eukprot:TRINITY_DN15670_c0_g1_i1.p1 TRINITY_DN15670_c0_g1~~TRINITY_DN15670_c0_g1_i1.p1  ORF type:complete len:721 (+),score=121.63 TRINITY_DN15670_c0_g1_i1:91-2253(+)
MTISPIVVLALVILQLVIFVEGQKKITYGDDNVMIREGSSVIILDMKTQILLRKIEVPDLDCDISGLDFDPCDQIIVWTCSSQNSEYFIHSYNLITTEAHMETISSDIRSVIVSPERGAFFTVFEDIGWVVYPFDYHNCPSVRFEATCSSRSTCSWDGNGCVFKTSTDSVASMRASKPSGGGISLATGGNLWMSWSEFDSAGIAIAPWGSGSIPVKNSLSMDSFDKDGGEPSYTLVTNSTTNLVYFGSIGAAETTIMRLVENSGSQTLEVVSSDPPPFNTPDNGKPTRQPAFAIGSMSSPDDTLIFVNGADLMYQTIGGVAESKYQGTGNIGPVLRFRSCSVELIETAVPTAIPTSVPTKSPTSEPSGTTPGVTTTPAPLAPGETYSPTDSPATGSTTPDPATTPVPPVPETPLPPGSSYAPPTPTPTGIPGVPTTPLPPGSTSSPAASGGGTPSPSSSIQPSASEDDDEGFPVLNIILIAAAVVVTCCLLVLIWYCTRVKPKYDVVQKQRELGGDVGEGSGESSYHPLNPTKEERYSAQGILPAPPVFEINGTRKRQSTKIEASRALKQLREGGHIEANDGVKDSEKQQEINSMKQELRLVLESRFTDDAVEGWKQEQLLSDGRTQTADTQSTSNRRSLPRVPFDQHTSSPLENTHSTFPIWSQPPTPQDEHARVRPFRSSTTVGTPRTPFSRRPPTTPSSPTTPYTYGVGALPQRVMM